MSRFELGIAAATLVGVVVLGVLQALVIAVALSILDVVRRSAQPRDAVLGWVDRLGRWGNVELHPSARVTPGVVVYRLDDRLFFANARYVKGRVREALRGAPDEARWLVFDAEAVSHVDATGLEALRELAVGLPRDGVGLVVARMKPEVYERLVAGGVAEAIGEERFFPTVRAAVAACLELDAARDGEPGVSAQRDRGRYPYASGVAAPAPPDAPPAFHLLAKPTGAVCNLDCSYCFFLSKEMLYPGSRFRMADELLEAYIGQLIEAHARVPEVMVAWQGGEPTMMGLEFFRRSVELADQYLKPGQRAVYTIQTNGTLLDDEWAAFFKEHDFLVGISIDGPQGDARRLPGEQGRPRARSTR